YDGDCGFCDSTRRVFEAIAVEPLAKWIPFQNASESYGIPAKVLTKRIHAVVDGRTYSGFAALKTLLLYNPAVYFVIAAMLAVPEPDAFPFRRWLAVALWLVFAPFFNPIGERVYGFVADRRHCLPGKSVCAVGAVYDRAPFIDSGKNARS